MTYQRSGTITAATWLIGLGLLLLAKQALAIDWFEAWPLFIVLAGAVGIVTTTLRGVHGLAGLWSYTGPVVSIVVGLVLLALTTGRLGDDAVAALERWWPAAAVALGVWFLIGAFVPRPGPTESLAVPLGGVAEASIRIRFGAGELTAARGQPGHLVDGRFEGGVVMRRDGPTRIELTQDTSYGLPWLERRSSWTVGLTGEVPIDLRVDTGAAKATLDLSDLVVRSLDLQTGASDTRIRLPRSAGATAVKAQTGAASLAIEVPAGVAARIRSRMGLGRTDVDQARFPRTGDGYASPDYATAPNRADIEVQGGVGSVKIVSVE